MREFLRDFPKTLKRESFFHCIVTNTGWKVSSIVFETFHVAEGLLLTAFQGRDVCGKMEIRGLTWRFRHRAKGGALESWSLILYA